MNYHYDYNRFSVFEIENEIKSQDDLMDLINSGLRMQGMMPNNNDSVYVIDVTGLRTDDIHDEREKAKQGILSTLSMTRELNKKFRMLKDKKRAYILLYIIMSGKTMWLMNTPPSSYASSQRYTAYPKRGQVIRHALTLSNNSLLCISASSHKRRKTTSSLLSTTS